MAAAADPGIGVRAFLAKEDPVFTWTGPGRTQANITDDSLQHEEEAR